MDVGGSNPSVPTKLYKQEVKLFMGLEKDLLDRAKETAETTDTASHYRGVETEKGYSFPSLSAQVHEDDKRVITNGVEYLAEHGITIEPLDLVRTALEKNVLEAVEARIQDLLEENS